MGRKKTMAQEGEPIIIKKYANRRLYNMQTSKYITLDFLSDLTKRDVDFVVIDAKSGDDITHSVLTQIIVEEESSGENMLPVSFLKKIISMYGGTMQPMVPEFLDNAMEDFRSKSAEMEDAFESAIPEGPLGDFAKQNIKMARAARDAFMPQSTGGAADEAQESSADTATNEVDALKDEMAKLQARLDELGG